MRAPSTAPPGAAGSDRQAELGLLLMVVLWAVNFSVIKVGLAEVPPFGFNALRFPLAAALLAGVLAAQGRLRLPEPRDVFRVVALGVIGNVFYQLFFIAGMDRSRAGNASLLLTGSPVYTALLSAVLGHERVRREAWLGIGLTVAGIGLVVGSGAEGGLRFGADTLAGDLLLICASAVWAVYTVGARDLIRKYGSVAVTAWTLWVGAALLLVVGLPDLLRLGAVSPMAWGSVAYAGFLGVGVSYLLWYRAVRLIGNTRTAAFSNLVPVLAIVVAWLWLGEVPNLWQLVGAVVIIGGVSLVRRAMGGAR